MKIIKLGLLLATATVALSACGGKGDDTLGSKVETAAENRADALEDAADNLEERAEAVRDEGERQSDAIDDADVNAAAMPAAEKGALINGTETLR